LVIGCLACGPALAAPIVIDDFEDISDWDASAPEGVKISISRDAEGKDGAAIRIDYDFVTGGGYCVLKKTLDLPLPENYRFDFDIRGEGKPNNLEFKIAGPPTEGGTNVWWVNRRAFEPPKEWRSLVNKRRSFEFAWGPSGGEPLQTVAGIEIAIAMAEGGKGTIWLDNLSFEELEAPKPYTATPTTETTAAGIDIDFHQVRDFGGIVLGFEEIDHPVAYDFSTSVDGATWNPIARVRDGLGGLDHFFTPDGNARALRIRWVDGDQRATLKSFDVMPLEVGDDINAFVERVAADFPKGWYPKQFTDKQCFWTVVGRPGSNDEGLFSEFGAYELWKGGPSIEPFLIVDGALVTWADAAVTRSLVDNYIPIPTVTWDAGGMRLDVTPIHWDGVFVPNGPGDAFGLVRYRITNTGSAPRAGSLGIAVRPFQVLPPWHRLNVTGGVSRVESIGLSTDGAHQILFDRAIGGPQPVTRFSKWFATTATQDDPVEHLASGSAGSQGFVRDDHGLASGAIVWEWALEPGASTDFIVRVPMRKGGQGFETVAETIPEWGVFFEKALADKTEEWRGLLNRVQLRVPPVAQHMWDTVRSNLGYILINADGPAIQPGSRAYERSWIRDGSLTGTALLTMGHADLVERFLRWYSDHLYDNGKVPCVVDKRGPDPYPEHDSPGQYIYLLLRTVLTTGDKDLARELYPKALAAVGYIESLRATRMTPEYKDPSDMRSAFYGILPESGSHEGYMNKPMHSFWDDFFALKGLKDMVTLAELVGDTENLPRLIALRDDFRACFDSALRRAIKDANIDYVPGCVELGDFDATSTAIGIFPCGELGWMPQPQTQRTFDKYWSVIENRRADAIRWHDYTPYETRIIGIFVLLGQPHRALELMDWLFRDQLPKGWNQWGEVAYRDQEFPGWIGDMPHTWVGSGYISSVRTMFVDEREQDSAQVLGAGIVPEWLDDSEGISVGNWPTEFGTVSYRLKKDGNRMILEVDAGLREPPGGIVFVVPGDGRIVSATPTTGEVLGVSGREVRIRNGPCKIEVVTE